jgi:hypothetical protein
VIAQNGVDPERRLQSGELLRPFARVDVPGDDAVATHIVPKQCDEVSAQLIGHGHDGTDALGIHPGAAGVDVGERRDLELEALRPALRREVVARQARPPRGLEGAIGTGEGAERTEAADPSQKLAP